MQKNSARVLKLTGSISNNTKLIFIKFALLQMIQDYYKSFCFYMLFVSSELQR